MHCISLPYIILIQYITPPCLCLKSPAIYKTSLARLSWVKVEATETSTVCALLGSWFYGIKVIYDHIYRALFPILNVEYALYNVFRNSESGRRKDVIGFFMIEKKFKAWEIYFIVIIILKVKSNDFDWSWEA